MYPPKDVTSQLADYILRNLSKGYNQDSLKVSLMSQGYSRITVENAIAKANKILAITLPPVKEKPQIIYRVIDEQNRLIKDVKIPIKKSRGFFKWLKELFE